jgi:hypothetical protein
MENTLERILVRKQAFTHSLRHSVHIQNSLSDNHTPQTPSIGKWRRWARIFYQSVIRYNSNNRAVFFDKVVHKLKLK